LHKLGHFALFFPNKCLLRGFSFIIIRNNFTEFCWILHKIWIRSFTYYYYSWNHNGKSSNKSIDVWKRKNGFVSL